MSDIAERVKKIVVEHLGVEPEKVIDSANFIDDLGADSLDTVELVMAFEEEFAVEIPDDAAETIRTVGDAVSSSRRRPPERLARSRSGEPAAAGPWVRCGASSSRVSAWSRRWLRRRADLVAPPRRRERRAAHVEPVRCVATCRPDRLRRCRAATAPTARSIADQWMDPKDQRKVDDFIVFGVAAAQQALTDAGWKPDTTRTDRHRRADRLGHRRARRHLRRLDHAPKRARAASRRSSFPAA